jgi:hypothetical protein
MSIVNLSNWTNTVSELSFDEYVADGIPIDHEQLNLDSRPVAALAFVTNVTGANPVSHAVYDEETQRLKLYLEGCAELADKAPVTVSVKILAWGRQDRE